MRLKFGVISLLTYCLISWPVNAAQHLTLRKIDGVLEDVDMGNASFRVRLRTPQKAIEWFVGPSTDMFEDQHDYLRFSRMAPPRLPSIADVGSRVRAWVVQFPAPHDQYFLSYEVLSAARPLWLVIIGSEKSEEIAMQKQRKAREQGFWAGRFPSKELPRLRHGFIVVTAGVFVSKVEARACVTRARQRGWSDAYLRQGR